MTLEVIIATKDSYFLQRKYKPPLSRYLVINQTQQTCKNSNNVFNYNEKGISISRNRALQKASADICLFADDDIVFLPSAEAIILNAFENNPDADIITFQAQTPEGGLFKPYSPKKKWHNSRSLMQVTSFEISFKTKSIATTDLAFDKRFGLGAKFPAGEENIFLLDAFRQGLKILYIPIPIVIHPAKSSGSNFNNKALILAKGAAFYRMFGFSAYIILLLFAYRKYPLSNLSYLKFYQLMCQGIRQYKKHQ